VSVGDPKKKYTCFEKIGQGLVYAPSLSDTFPYAKKESLKPGDVSWLEKLLVVLWRVWLVAFFVFFCIFGGFWLFWWVTLTYTPSSSLFLDQVFSHRDDFFCVIAF